MISGNMLSTGYARSTIVRTAMFTNRTSPFGRVDGPLWKLPVTFRLIDATSNRSCSAGTAGCAGTVGVATSAHANVAAIHQRDWTITGVSSASRVWTRVDVGWLASPAAPAGPASTVETR